jgi:hypothetical protein
MRGPLRPASRLIRAADSLKAVASSAAPKTARILRLTKRPPDERGPSSLTTSSGCAYMQCRPIDRIPL